MLKKAVISGLIIGTFLGTPMYDVGTLWDSKAEAVAYNCGSDENYERAKIDLAIFKDEIYSHGWKLVDLAFYSGADHIENVAYYSANEISGILGKKEPDRFGRSQMGVYRLPTSVIDVENGNITCGVCYYKAIPTGFTRHGEYYIDNWKLIRIYCIQQTGSVSTHPDIILYRDDHPEY